MKKKFTPGPWKVADLPNLIGGTELEVVGPNHVDADDCEYVAVVCCGLSEADEANAHLIAAAPDLYRELERAVRYFTDADNNREAWGKMVHEWQQTLAKARGES